MHHQDDEIRLRSLAFFQNHFESLQVCMNYEQIGICDAVIWLQSRDVQDIYYPFMDNLHSDMKIQRAGYSFDELYWARKHGSDLGLKPEQALLTAQVLRRGARLVTNDPAMLALSELSAHLWTKAPTAQIAPFPRELEALYEDSRCFIYNGQELSNG
tara:strand:- start:113 stop:583 length:471 start_codon:yes stop_codon:yes gene_type:complete